MRNVITIALLLLGGGCEFHDHDGSEDYACYGNITCNKGLVCVQGREGYAGTCRKRELVRVDGKSLPVIDGGVR